MQQEWTSSMSIEETVETFNKAKRLRAMGKKDAALAMSKRVPLDPEYADDLKRWEGMKFLIDGGFNLTDAVAKFGKEWLNV